MYIIILAVVLYISILISQHVWIPILSTIWKNTCFLIKIHFSFDRAIVEWPGARTFCVNFWAACQECTSAVVADGRAESHNLSKYIRRCVTSGSRNGERQVGATQLWWVGGKTFFAILVNMLIAQEERDYLFGSHIYAVLFV